MQIIQQKCKKCGNDKILIEKRYSLQHYKIVDNGEGYVKKFMFEKSTLMNNEYVCLECDS